MPSRREIDILGCDMRRRCVYWIVVESIYIYYSVYSMLVVL